MCYNGDYAHNLNRNGVIMAHEQLSEAGNTIYAKGTVLLDPATGSTYRAQEQFESFFGGPGTIKQNFSLSYAEGMHSNYTEKLPETAEVIWTPEEAR